MAETIILDPSGVATSRTAVDITPFVHIDGIDWGDAAITQQLAQGKIGSDPVDWAMPNRQVSIPMKLQARGTVTFDTIRRQLQTKVGLFQREQGWLSRVTSAGTLYADVVNASLRLGGDWMQANRSFDDQAVLSLELSPDWYGAEVTLDDLTETTAAGIFKVLKLSASDATINGDYPARVRMVVDDDQAQSQLGLLWGYRSRYYDSASTAALNYQAETLTPLDAAGTTTVASTVVMRHNALATIWTPVVSTQIVSGAAHMTHRGTYRAWARCYTTSGTTPDVRLVWDVGDLVYPVENTPQTLPDSSNFYMVDLGEIRLDAAPVGTHRWQGIIQAQGDSGGENLSVDQVFFQPLDDGAGRLVATSSSASGLAGFTAHDEFNQTAGALTGKTAPVGGVWAGAGGATDLSVNATTHTATTASVSPAAVRYLTLPVSMTSMVVTADVAASSTLALGWSDGILARYVDTSNYVRAVMTSSSASVIDVHVYKVVAGALTALPGAQWSGGSSQAFVADAFYTMSLTIDAAGNWSFAWGSRDGSPVAEATGQDSVFATGGALASGRPGLYDDSAASAVTRSFDNFAAWAPQQDAVLFASQSAELRTEGMFREDSTGAAYGPVSWVVGDLPRLPPSGLEGRKVEVFVKGSRGDFDQLPDPNIDDISARVFYRPSWLIAPGS